LITIVKRLNADLKARAEASGKRFAGLSVEPDVVGLEALAALADAGKLSVHIDRIVPFNRASDAHRPTQSARGKTILKVTGN